MEVVKGRGYVYSIQYHIVWCVKYRRDVLNGQVATKLKELLTQISKDIEECKREKRRSL